MSQTDSGNATEGQVRIPSLIGGFPTQDDFAPSILLIIFYFFSLFPFIRRLYDPDTRTKSLASKTVCFAIERIVVYSLRLAQSHRHRPGEDLGDGALVYQQLSFSVGYLTLLIDAISFACAVLVNTTLEDFGRGSKDQPLLRKRIRKTLRYPSVILFVCSQLGMVTFGFLSQATQSQAKANLFRNVRYVGDVIPLVICLAFIGGMILVRPKLEFLDISALDAIIKLSAAICVVPLYRLSVLHFTTTTLSVVPTPTYPASALTSSSAKATFYLFHALPEILVVYYIHCTNIRARFNTGPDGDWQQDDVKQGIPQLRQDGVIVDGVGVPHPEPEKPKRKGRWLKLAYFISKLWRSLKRRRHDDSDEESMMALLPMKSTSSDDGTSSWSRKW